MPSSTVILILLCYLLIISPHRYYSCNHYNYHWMWTKLHWSWLRCKTTWHGCQLRIVTRVSPAVTICVTWLVVGKKNLSQYRTVLITPPNTEQKITCLITAPFFFVILILHFTISKTHSTLFLELFFFFFQWTNLKYEKNS